MFWHELTGGQGGDLFVIEFLSGDDRITDFKGVDTIRFDASSGVDAFSDLTLTQIGGNTLITWGTTDSLLIEGVKPNKLDASDFDFGAAAVLVASRTVMEGPDSGQGAFQESVAGHPILDIAGHGLIFG